MKTLVPLLLLANLPGLVWAETLADSSRLAVQKAIGRLEQGAASYITKRKCFSCHHQALAIKALTSAKQRGFKVDDTKLKKQVEFTLRSFRHKERVAKGQGVDGASTTVVYALWSLESAKHGRDETTSAMIHYLLSRQDEDGYWPAQAKRPPIEGSRFVNAALAIRALRVYGPDKKTKQDIELRTRIDNAIAKGKEWLGDNEPENTEDMIFLLRGLIYAAAAKKDIAAARQKLLQAQHADGSWGQLPKAEGDAYATGNALMALRLAGLDAKAPAYQKAIKFLLKSQSSDGSWLVKTRSRPVQTFFDNGDPGGKSQFISFPAGGWALLALLEQFPVK